MNRSNMSNKSQLFRRAIRLALVVAITTPSGWAFGDDGTDDLPRDASTSAPDLPAYPFPTLTQSSTIKSKAQSSRQVIARILGFNQPKTVNGSNAMQAPQALPAMNTAPMQLPSLGQKLPSVDVRSAQAMIDHPQMSDIRSAASSSSLPKPGRLDQSLTGLTTSSTRKNADNAVLAASTAQKQGPVEHSLSDKDATSDQSNGPEMVDSLVNSLVASEPYYEEPAAEVAQFTDSINVQVAEKPEEAEKSEDTAISMNLSDRDDSPSEKLVDSKEALDNAPQLMSFSDKDSEEPVIAQAPAAKPTYNQVAARTEPTATKASSTSFENSVQDAVSSRREKTVTGTAKNELRAPESQTSSRQPLVPMLASSSGRARVNAEPRALQPVPTSSPVTTAELSMPTLSQSLVQTPMLPEPTFSQPALTRPAAVQPASAQPTFSAPAVTPPSTMNQVQGKEIHVSAKDSVSLQSIETIQAVSVEHDDICQIIQNGPKSYSVIGLRDGETRIAIISETNGQRNVQVQKVLVSSSKNATSKDNATLAAEISQTVSQLYPRQRVRIAPRGSQLVISGTVDSEDTAKKIVSLVRKTTLTPVVDELKTK